ncbi:Rab5-interacting family protein [Halomicrobium urmianum]|uniref:Rab5-interacting family protein n=1 Tax=Halomicrobium urmianum TaxID=1586233 RepID=UPI001CDA2141|nr:Rab5-interacting family protein [Halomicrobium urmianum]
MDEGTRTDEKREIPEDETIPGSKQPRQAHSIAGQSQPRLGSRILLTWLELTVFGITGGILGTTVGGPPGFIVYLATSLATVGIIFYNVNELVKGWMDVTTSNQ